MPAFRVEGDATAPLRGFAFIKKVKSKETIIIKKEQKYKKKENKEIRKNQ